MCALLLLVCIKYNKTRVDSLIVTDQASPLKTGLRGMSAMLHGVQQLEVWQPNNEQIDQTKSIGQYWLTYQHRFAIQSKLKQEDYTAVLYMEDDTFLSWPAIVSWALDTQLLQPLKFTRCFYRTEVHHATGTKVMLDWETKENLTESPTVDVMSVDKRSRARYLALSQQLRNEGCKQLASPVVQPCMSSLHRHFVSPSFPFQGMWLLNKQQLSEFMQHPYWSHNASLHADLGRHNFWGIPERSNSVNMFVHVPKDYGTNCMVPYIPVGKQAAKVLRSYPTAYVEVAVKPKLPAMAEVKHLRNGYGFMDCIPSSNEKARCGNSESEPRHFPLSSIPVDDAFIT